MCCGDSENVVLTSVGVWEIYENWTLCQALKDEQNLDMRD